MSIHSRTNPFFCTIKERYLLNKEGSTKETYHISLSLEEGSLPFQVGDSLAVFPENDPRIVDAIIAVLKFEADHLVTDRLENTGTLREYLLKKANISKCTTSFLKILRDNGVPSPFLRELLQSESQERLAGFLKSHEVIDLIQRFPGARLTPQQLCSGLLPMMPRFYSIASSLKLYSKEIHLTVATFNYEISGAVRNGVGSHFLSHLATLSQTRIPVYVQPSKGFTLPEDPNTPIIMIGPGTGIAPFRAFLQEKEALGLQSPSWLFFGERNRATDFYYEEYFTSLEKQKKLRIDLAFSRDSTEKTYVQHRLWEQRNDVWDWIQSKGACLYVCGDAEQMAKDVDATLIRIGNDKGLTEEKSREWLKTMKKNGRYLQDVY